MSKNPYVHPDEKNNMLNRATNNGYSFDEKDDDVIASTDDEWVDFDSYKPEEPTYIERIFVGDATQYDLPEIIEKLEEVKTDNRYGTDAISTFNLSHDISEFGRIDWSNYPNSRGMKDNIQQLLSECVVRSEKNSNPKDFKYLANAADIGEGELFDRKVREYRGLLSSGEYMIVSDKAYDISLDLSDNMNRYEWESYVESVYNDDMNEAYKEELDSIGPMELYGTDDYDEVKTKILERENMDVNTPDRELPWYVAKELEDAGFEVEGGPCMP